jgi:hypothetical protein
MSTGDAAAAAIVDMEMPEATKRFQSLWNSAFGMIQERNRLAHELETSADTLDHTFLRTFPYFSRNKSIMKHMHTLMYALDTWKKRVSASDPHVPTKEQLDAWTATVAQLLELLSHTGQATTTTYQKYLLIRTSGTCAALMPSESEMLSTTCGISVPPIIKYDIVTP